MKVDEMMACLKGPNCFVAGTQVVVAVSLSPEAVARAYSRTGAGENGLPGLMMSPESSETDSSLDAVFAAGAFALMAGLSYQQRRANRNQKRHAETAGPCGNCGANHHEDDK